MVVCDMLSRLNRTIQACYWYCVAFRIYPLFGYAPSNGVLFLSNCMSEQGKREIEQYTRSEDKFGEGTHVDDNHSTIEL